MLDRYLQFGAGNDNAGLIPTSKKRSFFRSFYSLASFFSPWSTPRLDLRSYSFLFARVNFGRPRYKRTFFSDPLFSIMEDIDNLLTDAKVKALLNLK